MPENTLYVVWDPRLRIVPAQSVQEALLVAQEQYKRSPPTTGELMAETLDVLATDPIPDSAPVDPQVASSPEAAERQAPDDEKPLGEDPEPEVTDQEESDEE